MTRGSSAEVAGLAADSRTVAAWTLVSRLTGFGRVACVAAVFGPTYFGNLFQTANLLPNSLHDLLTGSLVTAMLVPPLARCLDRGDRATAQRLACGFLGVMLLVFLVVVVLSVLAAPLVLALITSTVRDAAVRQQQLALGWPLLAVLMPQLLLYGIISACTAAQNAHGRFGLAAAAPALENLGTIVVVAASAVIFGTGVDVDKVSTAHLLLLGIGCTAAVALHAAVQWWGAYRVGIAMLPRAGWRDPEVRRIVRMALPSSIYAGLGGVSLLGLLIAAGSLPGGAVAFQIGLNFFNVPVALCARPVAAAQLPPLSRSFERGDPATFAATYRAGLAFTAFVALPAGFLFCAVPGTLAQAVSFGSMAAPAGVALVAASIGSLGPAVIGEALFLVSTSASYARRDAVLPLRAMAVRAVLTLGGMALALYALHGTSVLWALGLSASAANLAGAAFLHAGLLRVLPKAGTGARPLFGNLAAAAVATGSAALLARWLAPVAEGSYQRIAAALATVGIGAACYLLVQFLRGSEELRQLAGGLRGAGRRSRSRDNAVLGAAVPEAEGPP